MTIVSVSLDMWHEFVASELKNTGHLPGEEWYSERDRVLDAWGAKWVSGLGDPGGCIGLGFSDEKMATLFIVRWS